MLNFWSGLGFGAGFGTIATLLNTSQSGEELQKNLKIFFEESELDIAEIKKELENIEMFYSVYQQIHNDIVKPSFIEIKNSIDNFKFQATPRVAGIEKQLKKIETEIKGLEQTFL